MSEAAVANALSSMVDAPPTRVSTTAECPKCLALVACEVLDFEEKGEAVRQRTFAYHAPCGKFVDRVGGTLKPHDKAYVRVCAKCEAEFVVASKNSPQRFCSRACGTVANSAKGPNVYQRNLKTCAWCSIGFLPRTAKQMTCSTACAGKLRARNRGQQTEDDPVLPPPEEAAVQPEPTLQPEVAEAFELACRTRRLDPCHPEAEGALPVEESHARGAEVWEEVIAERRRLTAEVERLQRQLADAEQIADDLRAGNRELMEIADYERASERSARRLIARHEFAAGPGKTGWCPECDLHHGHEAGCVWGDLAALTPDEPREEAEATELEHEAEAVSAALNVEVNRLIARLREPEPSMWDAQKHPHRAAGLLAEQVPVEVLGAAWNLARALGDKANA